MTAARGEEGRLWAENRWWFTDSFPRPVRLEGRSQRAAEVREGRLSLAGREGSATSQSVGLIPGLRGLEGPLAGRPRADVARVQV